MAGRFFKPTNEPLINVVSFGEKNLFFRTYYDGRQSFDFQNIEEYWVRRGFCYGIMYLPKNSIVFDFGAYCGYYSLLIEHLRPDLKIYAFEPEKGNYDMLEKNIWLNNSKITPLNYAIASKDEELFLQKTNHDGTWKKSQGGERVKAITMNTALELTNEEHADYIKIDIEGMEKEVIFSIKDELQNVWGLDVEIHGDVDEEFEISSFLEKNGFNVGTWKGPIFCKFEAIKNIPPELSKKGKYFIFNSDSIQGE